MQLLLQIGIAAKPEPSQLDGVEKLPSNYPAISEHNG